jgi:hypothetical protein
MNIRPGNIIVAARNPNHLEHLMKVLSKTDIRRQDVVVMTVRVVGQAESGEHGLDPDQVFAQSETALFSRVVAVAEKAGKHVKLLTVAGSDPATALVQTAALLKTARIVTAPSHTVTAAEQGQIVGSAWEKLLAPRPSLSLEIVTRGGGQSMFFNLGPHPPRLWPEDVDLTHQLWLELRDRGAGNELRHRDVVSVALRRLQHDMQTASNQQLLGEVVEIVHEHGATAIPEPEQTDA